MRPLLATFAGLTVALAAGTAFARDTITASILVPGNHVVARHLYTDFAEFVAQRSGGSLKIKTDLGTSVLSVRGVMSELADGLTDLTTSTAHYSPEQFPLSLAIEELALLYSDPRVVLAAVTEYGFNDPGMQQEWANLGIVFGGGYVTAPYELVCNTPIVSINDVKGARMRMPGRSSADWISSIGGAIVSFNTNEQYGALDTGALTCTTTVMSDVYARKTYEVAKHVTSMPINLFWAGVGYAYNAETWADLTAEQRRTLFDATADAYAHYVVNGIGKEEVSAREQLMKAGVTFHTPSKDLQASLDEYRAKQPAVAEAVARDTYKIGNAAEELGGFQKAMERWNALLADVPQDDAKAYADLLRREIFDRVDVTTYPAR